MNIWNGNESEMVPNDDFGKTQGSTELDLHKNSKDNNASWKDFQQMLWIKTDFQTKRFIFLNKVGLGRRKRQTDNPFPMPSSFSKSHVWSLQSCSTFGDPMDCSPPNSSAHGISQTRILGWLLFPPPGDLPNPGIKPTSPVSYIARIKPTSPVSPTLQAFAFTLHLLLSHPRSPFSKTLI